MALKSITLIPEQTGVVTTPVFNEIVGGDTPATLIATGLAGVEEVDVLISVDNGVSNQPVVQEGTTVKLTVTNNTVTINSPMTVGVIKDTTVGAAGVFLSKQGFA